MSTHEPPRTDLDDEPDPRLLWRWAGDAVRPWLGWILVALGALLMLLGYLGVSREALPAKQIPYLVSGGIGGMFLAVLGAYFLGAQQLRSDSGRLDRLEQMVTELHQALLRRPDAPDLTVVAPSTNGLSAPRPAARRVVVPTGAERYHRADCALVSGKEAEDMAPTAARKRGLQPCPVCEPGPSNAALVEPAPTSTSTTSSAAG
jgi:hypothetical protein